MQSKHFHLVLVFFSALASAAASQADNAEELLKHTVANLHEQDLKREGYTFTEDYHNVNYDKNGKIKVDQTARFETVFVEGTPYKCKIEEDGKPLSRKAAEEEEKRYQATVAERRRMNAEHKQTLFHREYQVNMRPEDWPSVFLAALAGKETVDGHEATKLLLTPRPDVKPKSEPEKDELSTTIQLWVDPSDEHPLRMHTEYTKDGAHILKGGSVDIFWQKDPKDGVYLMSRALIQYRVKYLLSTIPGMTEQTFSNYKRFGVDVHITTEPLSPE